MGSIRGKVLLFINLLSIIRASQLETIHFTNSAKKILKANNFTTYKVDVPNGEPITIIEANMPLIDKKIKFDDVEPASAPLSQYPIKQNSQYHVGDSDRKYNKPVMDLETSLSMTVTPNNYNDEYDNNAASIGEESVKNDYSNLSPDEQQHVNTRNTLKTVYSPELLQKFLKDYANKIHAATSTSSTASYENLDENRSEVEKDKYVESVEQTEINNDEDGNRRVSSANEEDDKSEENEDIQQRKNYRPHPYNKNNGWVTLDAVPWSKSKVSKWQSNNKNFNSNSYNRPYRPQSSNYDYDYNGNNNDNDDYYNSPKPSRPTYHNNQFYHNKPPYDSRPSSQQFHSTSSHHSSSSNYNFDNDQRPNRPSSSSDIITDNRPSNFPSHNEDHHHHSGNGYHQYQTSKPVYSTNNRPSSFNDYSYNNNQYHGGNYHSYKDGPHPATYPHNGDGEWILVSTTKGYQYPKRNGQRAISFKTQNSVGGGGDMQYNDNSGIITAAESQNVHTVVRPHHHHHHQQHNYYAHRPSPTKMSQQQAVKLTVLPLFVNNDKKPSSNGNYHSNSDKVNVGVYKPPQYHGIIESDQSQQTVEESAMEAHGAQAQQTSASQTSNKKKKRKVYKKKNYALMRKNGNGSGDSSAVIAAVGASLLPASLGLIAPMVLGK